MAVSRKHGSTRAADAARAKSGASKQRRAGEPKGVRTGNAKGAAKGTTKGTTKGAPVPAPLAPRFHRYALPRTDAGVRHWLLKTEPEVFAFGDLQAAPQQTACWDGVRNFQARNFMRDHMRVGDLVLIYHSNAEPPAVAGIARVVREAYPDHTAFDAHDDHFDPKSDPAAPTWMMVDVQAVQALRPVALATLRESPGLEAMELVQRGSRLSITPLTPAEWAIVVALGGAAGR
jgi:predicted RNA-binding protein with PUA-like domain